MEKTVKLPISRSEQGVAYMQWADPHSTPHTPSKKDRSPSSHAPTSILPIQDKTESELIINDLGLENIDLPEQFGSLDKSE